MSRPVSEWPNEMTGQPPFGGTPAGTATTPETCVGSPVLDVERYTTRTADALADCRTELSVYGLASTSDPGPSSVISAGGNWAAPANAGCNDR
jgi:hypothetical protein